MSAHSNANAGSGTPRWLRDGVVSLLLFLLLLEWLRPLPALADIAEMYVVYPYAAAIGIFIATDYVRIPGWAGWPWKVAVCLIVTGYVFSSYRMPGPLWWIRFLGQLMQDANAAWGGQFDQISAETRTFLFVLGWALMISVIQALMVQRQHGLWFIAGTLIYLLTLSLFLGADTGNAVVRTCWMGLVLLAALNLPRVERRFGLGARTGWPWKWLAAGALLVLICVGAGWYGAGTAAQEKPPVDWSLLSGWTSPFADNGGPPNRTGLAAYAVSGYGEDDSRLGGPLRQDDRIAFTARTSKPTYWRADSRSTYDGKGWVADDAERSEPLPDAVGAAHGANASDSGSVPDAANATDEANAAGAGDLPVATGLSSAKDGGSGETERSEPLTDASGAANRANAPGAADADDAAAGSASAVDAARAGYAANAPDAGSAADAAGGTVLQEVKLTETVPTNTLFIGGPLDKLEALVTAGGRSLPAASVRWNPATGKYSLTGQGDTVVSYRVVVREPLWWDDPRRLESRASGESPDALRPTGADASPRSGDQPAGGRVSAVALTAYERERYLQLPDELPQRVKDLAQSISSAAVNPYNQAMLLQNYLRTHYAYSLDKPTYPQDGEDFVDHFLFVDRLGYCDQFSTALTVMLRAVGIPARWVKGFAPGEIDGAEPGASAPQGAAADAAVPTAMASAATAAAESPPAGQGGHPAVSAASLSTPGSERLVHVTVRNRDAHSWVEAYLPGAGWVAFEPTPGFAPAGAGAAPQKAAAVQAAALPAATAQPLQERLRADAIGALAAAAAAWRWIAGALLLLAPLLWAAWRRRAELAFRLAARGYRQRHGAPQQLRVLERLWRRLFRRFGAKPPQQTLREYVAGLRHVDAGRRGALIAFAQLYESLRYDRDPAPRLSRRQLARLWLGIVRAAPEAKREEAPREEASRLQPPTSRKDFLDADV